MSPRSTAISIFLLLGLEAIGQGSYTAMSSVDGAASYCLAYQDQYLYSGEGNTLSIYDVSDGMSPPYQRVFRMRFNSFLDDIIINDDELWIAANTDGLYKLDISNPESPTMIAEWHPPALTEAVYDVALAGDTVFVANKTKLTVLRDAGDHFEWISDLYTTPSSTSRIRGCDTKNGLLVFTVATMSIVHGTQDGVHFYDSKTFMPMGYYRETYGDHEEVIIDAEDSILHVMAGGQFTSSLPFPFSDPRGHYYVLDISEPSNPVRLFSDTIPGVSLIGDTQVFDADLKNDTIYVATRTGDDQIFPLDGNVFVYDVTEKASIRRIADVGVGLLHFDVALQGDILQVASEWFGVRSIDISDLSSPQDLGDTQTGGWTETTDIHGNLMVQANEGFATQLYDISNPSDPVLIARHINIENGFNFGARFSADGQYVFAQYLEGNTLDEFRVLEVPGMQEVASLNFFTGFEDARVWDSIFVAYADPLLGAGYLSFVNVGDPLQPSLISTAQMAVNDMENHGRFLIACRDDALISIDLSQQQVVDSVLASGEAFVRLAVFDGDIFTVKESSRVDHYTVELDGSLTFVESLGTLPLGPPRHLATDGAILHAGYTEFGLFAYSATDLVLKDTFRTGLDFIFPFWWELEDLQVFGDRIALTEYFGQTTLLTFSDSTTSVQGPGRDIQEAILFPNPTTGSFSLAQIDGCPAKRIVISDMKGSIVIEADDVTLFNDLILPDGIFFLNLVDECGTIRTQRLVVIND